MRYALVGNPNCGKTTIFNVLTGLNQKVGNWSGVTVDKKVGYFKVDNQQVEIVDIPGIYSLSASDNSSIDEQIAFNYVIQEKPDAIINVLDASNLERSMYLTIQLLELNVPMILAINMVDVANKNGVVINFDGLSKLLGINVFPVIGSKGVGINELKNALVKPQLTPHYDLRSHYSEDILALDNQLQQLRQSNIANLWLAGELYEGRTIQLEHDSPNIDIDSLLTEHANLITNSGHKIPEIRYSIVDDIIEKTVNYTTSKSRRNVTQILDSVCMNRFLGIPVFLMMMYLMFFFSITFGSAVQPLFDDFTASVFIDGVAYYSNAIGLPEQLTMILSQGLGTGINTVLAFIPQIGFLFIFLSLLEDSGYMSRAAFVIDRFMQSIGLSGKAFVPMIVGFGCNVASIMASRTLETREDRLMTIMMSPFMSCGARLAIFSVFATAFFPEHGASVIFLLYLLGIIAAILTGYVIKFTFLKNEATPFVLDIPKYHLPHFSTIMLYSWNRLKSFLLKAGKVIVPIAIIIGSLNSIDVTKNESALSYAGKQITPIFAPMGVSDDNWQATVGLMTGVLAKEVVVGTLNTLYTQDDSQGIPDSYSITDNFKNALYTTWDNLFNMDLNPITSNEADANMSSSAMGNMTSKFSSGLAAFSYLLFVLLYIPCISVIGATVRESTRGWAVLSILWSSTIAYTSAVVVYQLGNIFNTPVKSIIYSTIAIIGLGIVIAIMRYLSTRIKFVANLTGCSTCQVRK
ncbi:Fe(2+) transporter permease subunit FeoB [Francisella philomiragia]|uniref:Fe(2+) transporter permease subunit FeoB n=1 Tax=Francisella philomiragia TaxID=28110 RepID=UPI001905B41F|nr:Fe(2+) transporter permease subunit FeoB [Francisella philomiragia]MBK2256685.1 Fe(2+) transporter permease subunit FeoB [Francisella philomiragia]MBK2269343.1 Fe(2+) transporter permease subunit FeoB [Francisella philomiragia]MBK2271292.1 Fe(2+) transporter permease subunit FeoB [Francisella philomiragia]MBK2275072.1 Fe(2+) transporter permease subunit FeoB [Francisella philomiragia]MBK2294666.1 Fe(2+) transporter permease subunit FeoB [Francisella philomiragia]